MSETSETVSDTSLGMTIEALVDVAAMLDVKEVVVASVVDVAEEF